MRYKEGVPFVTYSIISHFFFFAYVNMSASSDFLIAVDRTMGEKKGNKYFCTHKYGESAVFCDMDQYCLKEMQYPTDRCLKKDRLTIRFPHLKPCGDTECPINDTCVIKNGVSRCVPESTVTSALAEANSTTFTCDNGSTECNNGEICHGGSCITYSQYNQLSTRYSDLLQRYNDKPDSCPPTALCPPAQSIPSIQVCSSNIDIVNTMSSNLNFAHNQDKCDGCVTLICNVDSTIGAMYLSQEELNSIPNTILSKCTIDTSRCPVSTPA